MSGSIYTREAANEFLSGFEDTYTQNSTNKKYLPVLTKMKAQATLLLPETQPITDKDKAKAYREFLGILYYAALRSKKSGKFRNFLIEQIQDKLFEEDLEQDVENILNLESLLKILRDDIDTKHPDASFASVSSKFEPRSLQRRLKFKLEVLQTRINAPFHRANPRMDDRHRKNWITDNKDNVKGDIALGTIPGEKDAISIVDKAIEREKPIGLIVSVVELFELHVNNMPDKPVLPDHWKDQNIQQVVVPIVDETADINVDLIVETLNKMNEVIEQGMSVYVHCKAGQGRSPMLVAAYLAIFDDELKDKSPEDAVAKAYRRIKAERV